MVSAADIDEPPFRLARILPALWSRATWRRTQLVSTGALLSIGGGSLLVPFLCLSIVLTPTVIGAVVALGFLVSLSRGLARLHRRRVAVFVGVELPEPVVDGDRSWFRRLRAEVTRRRTWRQIGFHLVAVLLAVIEILVVAAGFAWSVVMLPAAFYAAPVLGVSVWAGVLASIAGVALLLAAPWAVRLVAWADTELVRRLLGPSADELLSERLAEVTQSRAGVVDAADSERRRIERDLHDGVQQRLTSLAVHLGIARTHASDDGPTRQALDHAHTEVKSAIADLRDFLRGLHPAVLDDRGLDAALSGIAARSPIPVRLQVDLQQRPSREVEAVAYFLVSEALTNVLAHADASHASVEVSTEDGALVVTVRDDGRGGADPSRGSGLQGLRRRLAAVDGILYLDSPIGGPTVVRGELPCGS